MRWITKQPHAPWHNDDLRSAKRIKRRAQRIFWKTGVVLHKDVSTEAYIPAEFISFSRKKRKEKKKLGCMIQQKKLQNKKKVLFVLEEIYVFCFFLSDFDR